MDRPDAITQQEDQQNSQQAEYRKKYLKLAEHTYQKRIHTLMAGGSERVLAIYVDVTEDRLLNLIWKREDKQISDVRAHEWIEKNIFPLVLFQEELILFKECVNWAKLARKFWEGRTESECVYRTLIHNAVSYLRVKVTVSMNPENEHMEAYLIWENATTEWMDKNINRILQKEDYVALGLFALDRQYVVFRACNFEEVLYDPDGRFYYGDVIRTICEEHIQEGDRARFLQNTGLTTLKENMEISGQQSFLVKTVTGKVEKHSFFWYDRTHGVILFTVTDMTAERERDSISGTVNKQGFLRKADEILHSGRKLSLAVIYFNLSKFRAINELLGYEEGDAILREWITKIQNSYLMPLVVGRMEADHIVALVETKNLILERLPEVLFAEYHSKKDIKINLYARCGIYYVEDGCRLSVEMMCDRARLAKKQIRNLYARPYAIYTEEMQDEYERKSEILLNLEDAIAGNELHVFYQPVCDGKTAEMVSAEALVRWISPQRGVISPAAFIPELEESGQITKLDTYVHNQVRALLEKRYAAGQKVVPVSVNMSRMDLMDSNTMEAIEKKMQQTFFPKELLRYEITESAYEQISDMGTRFLAGLREKGVLLLVDDFGSGVSSVSALRDWDFDIVKIDAGFIRKINKNEKVNSIIFSLIDMIHRLHMKVVAEGVETREQLDFLNGCNCDYIQGYYFSKPLPEQEFIRKLEDSVLAGNDFSENRGVLASPAAGNTEKKQDLMQMYDPSQDNGKLEEFGATVPGAYHRCADTENYDIIYMSKYFLKLLDFSREEIKEFFRDQFVEMIHPEDREMVKDAISEAVLGEKAFNAEYRIMSKRGYIWVRDQTRVVYENGYRYLAGVMLDVSDLMKKAENLKYMSYQDVLTGAYNRRRFEEDYEAACRFRSARVGCVYMDAVGLHEVNNQQGHKNGDKLLCSIAHVATDIFASGKVYRIGGDEFVVLQQAIEEKNLKENVESIRRILASMGHQVSMGVAWEACLQKDSRLVETAEERMREDKALYYKTLGGDRRMRSREEERKDPVSDVEAEKALLSVLQQEYMGCYFVDLSSDKVTKIVYSRFQGRIIQNTATFRSALEKYEGAYLDEENRKKMQLFHDYEWLTETLRRKGKAEGMYQNEVQEKIRVKVFPYSGTDTEVLQADAAGDRMVTVWLFGVEE